MSRAARKKEEAMKGGEDGGGGGGGKGRDECRSEMLAVGLKTYVGGDECRRREGWRMQKRDAGGGGAHFSIVGIGRGRGGHRHNNVTTRRLLFPRISLFGDTSSFW